MDKIGSIGKLKTGAFYTRDDWGKPDQPSIWGQGVPSNLSATIDFVFVEPGNIWGLYVSNNLYFNFNGTVRAGIDRNDGTFYTLSDKRLKKNISEITPVLNKVMQLSVKKYQFIDTETSRYSTGFLSQEAIELFPEFVSAFKRDAKDSTSYLAINYAGFSVIAIKAIQEQQAVIDRQQKSIEFLASEIDKLKSSLSFIQRNK